MMDDTSLLLIAIIVFITLVIGLALTVYEFKNFIMEPKNKGKNK